MCMFMIIIVLLSVSVTACLYMCVRSMLYMLFACLSISVSWLYGAERVVFPAAGVGAVPNPL